MSFRERMSVIVSNAEYWVLHELVRRRLNRRLETQMRLPLDFEADRVHGTIIDFAWGFFLYASYLDGKWPHRSGSRQSERDELIDAALRKRGWTVDRFGYDPPLSIARGAEIVDGMENSLLAMGYHEEK